MRPACLALLLALSATLSAHADNWPQWRGPLGTGISAEKSAPLEWSKDKNIAWSIDMPGPGNSTPIIWGDKLFLTSVSKDGQQRGTYCYDAKTGKELWSKTVEYTAKEVTHDTNPACSASPVTDGERLIVWHGSAGVYCYDLGGQELWKKDVGKFEHIWGTAASPVIHKESVILNLGPGLHVGVVALNKKSGDEIWRKEYEGMKSAKLDEYRGSWSTPVIYNDGIRDVMLLQLPEKLRAVDPLNGDEIWSCAGPSKLYYTSPLVAGDTIVSMCGFHGPALAVKAGGTGDVTDSHRLWMQTEKNPQRVGSGVVVGEKVYILNEDGVAWCLDAKTGEIHWRQRLGGNAWSSAVSVAGRVYFTNMQGVTYVIEPNPENCVVLAENKLDGKTMRASIAVSDGRMYLRTYEKLWCVEQK